VPFTTVTVTVAPLPPWDLARLSFREKDKKLLPKLLEEKVEIMSWLVGGCRQWAEGGLGTVPEIDQASQVWRDESDPLSGFVEECCVLEPDAISPITESGPVTCRGARRTG